MEKLAFVLVVVLSVACTGEHQAASAPMLPGAAGGHGQPSGLGTSTATGSAGGSSAAPMPAPSVVSGDAPAASGSTSAATSREASTTEAPRAPESNDAVVPAPPKNAPAVFRQLTRATVLEIKDEWNGLGDTHDSFVRLERREKEFAVQAKVVRSPGTLGERVPDPSTPRESDAGPRCICAVTETCACEGAPEKIMRKSGSVSAEAVERFLAFIASHAIDPKQEKDQRRWTDDYPQGHVLVMLPGRPPVHLSFLNQRRQWRFNGTFLSREPFSNEGGMSLSHSSINRSYTALLREIGLFAWVKEVH